MGQTCHGKEAVTIILSEDFVKELQMAKVQFTVSFSIAAATPPLAESATSGSVSGTVGQSLSVASGLDVVSGGVPPYSVAVDPSSPNPLPPGVSVSIDPASGNLVVSGTPTAAGSGAVVLAISDSGQ